MIRNKRYRRSWNWDAIGMLALGSALVLGLGIWIAVTVVHRRACTNNGGERIKYNCQTVEDQVCTTTDFGNTPHVTTCTPQLREECDEKCVGARVEAE